jgi:hypothetical protein
MFVCALPSLWDRKLKFLPCTGCKNVYTPALMSVNKIKLLENQIFLGAGTNSYSKTSSLAPHSAHTVKSPTCYLIMYMFLIVS